MDWFGDSIRLWNSAYNCTLNDPMEYLAKDGLKRISARIKYEMNRRILKRLLGRADLPVGPIATERTAEIPLAVHFLERCIKDEPVLELGCVLPYYISIPKNHVVYDLLDRHPANTPKDLRDLTDEDYQTNILSVSTIEHINMDDLGIKQNAITAMDVLSRIRTNAKKYFVTFPLGYNAKLDQYVFASIPEEMFVTRREDDQNDWKIIGKTDLSDAQKKYGGYCGANTFCVISNGYGPLGATK